MVLVSLRSGDFKPGERVEAFQNAVAHIAKLNFLPDDLDDFRSETTLSVLPDLIIGLGRHSASTAVRTDALAADTGDNVMFHMPLAGGYAMRQSGGLDWELQPGMIYLDPNEVAGVVKFSGRRTDSFYVSIPRVLLASACSGLNDHLRKSCALTPQWRLFRDYARSLLREAAGMPMEDLHQYVSHMHDLALVALGATRDAAEEAQGRGVRAARMKSVKAEIERCLTQHGLNAEMIARREGVSPRYIRSLFEGEGMSFGDYVAQRRLLLAHRMLRDPACLHLNISQIAMNAGFGDLSWFNARFKRAFSASPSDIRAAGFAA